MAGMIRQRDGRDITWQEALIEATALSPTFRRQTHRIDVWKTRGQTWGLPSWYVVCHDCGPASTQSFLDWSNARDAAVLLAETLHTYTYQG